MTSVGMPEPVRGDSAGDAGSTSGSPDNPEDLPSGEAATSAPKGCPFGTGQIRPYFLRGWGIPLLAQGARES